MQEGELERARIGGQIARQPLVLRAARLPVIGIIVGVVGARAQVGVVPGSVEHIEARVAGIEGIPGAGIVAGRGAVEAAVGLAGIEAAGGGDGAVLGPVDEVGMGGIGAVEAMIADSRENG